MARSDRIFAVCIILLGVTYLYAASLIEPVAHGDPVGPKAFPILIGVALIGAAVGLLLEPRRTSKVDQSTGDKAAIAGQSPHNVPAVAAVFIWMTAYVVLLEPVGFLLDCPVFMLGIMAYFHRGHWIVNTAVSVGFTVMVYVLFTKFLLVPLPEGLLSF